MFENVFKLLKKKEKNLYIFDTRGGAGAGGGSTTRFLGLNRKPYNFREKTNKTVIFRKKS